MKNAVDSPPGSGATAGRLFTKGRTMLIGAILVSVTLSAVGQLMLKHGMNLVTDHGVRPLQFSDPLDALRRVIVNWSVWAGLVIFMLSAAVWLIVLSKVSLSFAYPFVSVTYILILLFDRFALGQSVSGVRWAGVALIIGGIVLISRAGAA